MHLHIHCDFILCYLPLLSLSLGSKKIWKRIFPTRKTNQFQNSLSQLSRLHSASCPLFPLTSYPTPTSKSEIVGWSYSPHIRWRSSPPCSMRTRNITSRHMALEKKKIDLVHNNHYVLSTTCPDSKDIGIESANVMFYRKSLIS